MGINIPRHSWGQADLGSINVVHRLPFNYLGDKVSKLLQPITNQLHVYTFNYFSNVPHGIFGTYLPIIDWVVYQSNIYLFTHCFQNFRPVPADISNFELEKFSKKNQVAIINHILDIGFFLLGRDEYPFYTSRYRSV